MEDPRLKDWHPLFERAFAILASAERSAGRFPWSFGGGTVLMLRHHHRYSRDVDIFVPDPQSLGFLSPRLNEVAGDLTNDFDEQATYLKLRFPEGEIDFVATGWLTHDPHVREDVLGHAVNVETSAEIVGKKLWYRADTFKARDFFDLATVLERDPAALEPIAPLLREKGPPILARAEALRGALLEEFEALALPDRNRDFAGCVESIRRFVERNS